MPHPGQTGSNDTGGTVTPMFRGGISRPNVAMAVLVGAALAALVAIKAGFRGVNIDLNT